MVAVYASCLQIMLRYMLLLTLILSDKLQCVEQELSYRKQIAHQLCTQYVEGICDNSMTLKSRLRVTQVTGNGTIG